MAIELGEVNQRRAIRIASVDIGDFRAALGRVKAFLDAGRGKEAAEALNINEKTLRHWVQEEKSALRANKAQNLLDNITRLPPTDRNAIMYSYILDDLDEKIADQIDRIRKHDGNYIMIHNFPVCSIKYFRLKADRIEGVALFAFNYYADNKKRRCDGFVILRNQRIFLLGVSKTSIFYGALVATVDHRNEVMYGAAAFEDRYKNDVFFSPIALIPTNIVDTLDLTEIKQEIRNRSVDRV